MIIQTTSQVPVNVFNISITTLAHWLENGYFQIVQRVLFEEHKETNQGGGKVKEVKTAKKR